MKELFIGSGNVDLRSVSLINQACLEKEQSTRGTLLSFKKDKKIRMYPFKFGFILCLLKNIFSNRCFGIRILAFQVDKIQIGRYCVSSAYRSDLAYKYKIIYLGRLFFYLYKSYCYTKQINAIVDSAVALYAYDPSYMYGILCEFAIKNKIPLYHNRYPYRLCRLNTNDLNHVDDLFRLPYNYSVNDIKAGHVFINQIIKDSSKISYMQGIDFSEISTDVARSITAFECDAIIYVHSFSDAQQALLDNTFLNVFDWLSFTLKILRNKNVIIKAHPSFWTKSSNNIHKFDQNIWSFFLKKYKLKNRDNIMILDFPIANSELLKYVNSNCTLISHHGNALLEGSFLGFKCISSNCTPWKNFNLFNSWNDKSEYEILLNKIESLRQDNHDDLLGYIGRLYGSDESFNTSKAWLDIAATYLECRPSDLRRDPSLVDKLSTKHINQIISKTASQIPFITC